MLVLGIESSCDETAVAVYDADQGLLSNIVHSQVDLHAEYGGVVPELASRDHIQSIIPVIDRAIKAANISKNQLNGIAYTAGPGLMGSLLVGASVAKTLAWSLDIPSIGIHHMEGHLMAAFLAHETPQLPFLSLLVSGGHSLIIEVKAIGDYHILGQSLDDAVGEAFDKTAKMLGLSYPGGPAIAKLAEQGHDGRYHFPRPMTNRPGLDMSFSGLKTFVLNTWQESDKSEQIKADIALAFQQAVVDCLKIKSRRAIKQTGINRLVIAGGVSANQHLREIFAQLSKQDNVQLIFPELEYCGDNGAMIAYAGCMRLSQGEKDDEGFQTKARWNLSELTQLQ